MTDIPDDVVERARVVYNEAFVRCCDPLLAALRVAVEWEREQCARAAIDWQRSYSLNDCCDIAQDAACEAIAAAIRSRKD